MDEILSSWTVNTDNHMFHLFWGSDEDKNKVQKEQSHWLEYLDHYLAE